MWREGGSKREGGSPVTVSLLLSLCYCPQVLSLPERGGEGRGRPSSLPIPEASPRSLAPGETATQRSP